MRGEGFQAPELWEVLAVERDEVEQVVLLGLEVPVAREGLREEMPMVASSYPTDHRE